MTMPELMPLTGISTFVSPTPFGRSMRMVAALVLLDAPATSSGILTAESFFFASSSAFSLTLALPVVWPLASFRSVPTEPSGLRRSVVELPSGRVTVLTVLPSG